MRRFPPIRRRPLLLGLIGGAGLGALPVASTRAASAASADPAHRAVTLSDAPLQFPRDHGAHPETRIEWWYVTGLLRPAAQAPPSHGFQLTFFRIRHDLERPLDSAFAPDQLIMAHAAVSDIGRQRLLHDHRLLRHGFANARAEQADTGLRLGDWSLVRHDVDGRSRYRLAMRSETAGFALSLTLRAPLPPLLQGRAGWSSKGPLATQASRYVSEPQLAGDGRLALRDQAARPVLAQAWLDHEWAQSLLGRGSATGADAGPASADAAIGWDWMGLNLDDGGALTLFQTRRADGGTLWTGGSWRDAHGRQQDFQQQLRFEALAWWQSPLSRARYPTRWRLHTPRGVFLVEAAFEAQEMDARASAGLIYWEGVATLRDAAGRALGAGYLEMTGYAGRVPL